MAYKFKVGDTGKTRDGQNYRVICTDMRSVFDTIVALLHDDDSPDHYHGNHDYQYPEGLHRGYAYRHNISVRIHYSGKDSRIYCSYFR